MKIRTRYAPSPTGNLHIGNARAALFSYLFARHYDGEFIVRIEDTDTERNTKDGVESQLKYLKWLGIDWDESVDVGGEYGPYNQLSRLELYQKYATELMDKGLAYKCYCTKEELAAEREEMMAKGISNIHYSRKCLGRKEEELPYSIRFKVPANVTYTFDDVVKGEVSFESNDIGDWVLMKNNGIPTYNFACVVDDHLMKISHVLRGEDHLTNTPKQMMVYDAFGWEYPVFGHTTLIVNENSKKLSKRDESIIQFIEQYESLGYLPDALLNFIGLLGWSPVGEEEILCKEDFIKQFDESRLSKSPAKFDKDKLTYINNRYIKELDLDALVTLCKPHLINAGLVEGKNDEWMKNLIAIFQDRMSFGKEVVSLYNEFFDEEFHINEEGLALLQTEGVDQTLAIFRKHLEQIDDWNEESIWAAIKQTGKDAKVKGKMLYMPLRVATTGHMHGPDLTKVLKCIGKDEIVKRLL